MLDNEKVCPRCNTGKCTKVPRTHGERRGILNGRIMGISIIVAVLVLAGCYLYLDQSRDADFDISVSSGVGYDADCKLYINGDVVETFTLMAGESKDFAETMRWSFFEDDVKVVTVHVVYYGVWGISQEVQETITVRDGGHYQVGLRI